MSPSTPSESLTLAARLANAEANVRSDPARVAYRWELFQLLCVLAQWERAVQQLQVCARQQPGQLATAHACRDLIRAEKVRARVFAGETAPGFIKESPPWVQNLIGALGKNARGDMESADNAREAALSDAQSINACFGGNKVDWISDSDSRLGPVCEIITAKHYRWLPIADIARWQIERPATLLELVWAPCTLTLHDGTDLRGFMPARYPVSINDDDALRLGNATEWREVGRTAVIGMGRKTWSTSAGDFSVFELASCDFGVGMKSTPASDPESMDIHVRG
jgi:type VI secretion system protein ImpE